LAAVAEQYEWRYAESDQLYRRALETDPRNSRARSQRAFWRLVRSAIPDEEAIAEARQAVQDDPLNAWVVGMFSFVLGVAGRQDESLAEAERSVALDAESFFAQWNLMRACAWSGRYDRAMESAPGLLADSGRHPWALGLLAFTHGRAGRAEEAKACYDELEGRSRHEFVPSAWLAIAAGWGGLEGPAVRWAERAAAERDVLVQWSSRLPFWDFLRAHGCFARIVATVAGSAPPTSSSP
jgi:tetratricopeptide (TPR) repeat protein